MNIVIIGAGGHGKVVLDILRHDRRINIVGFIDDNRHSHGQLIDGVPVLGDTGMLEKLVTAHHITGAIVAVGDNQARSKIFSRLKDMGIKIENAIHPGAIIARDVTFGEGVVVASGVKINTGTKIGNDVIINTGVIIDHDIVIEDHVHLSPGVKISGGVNIKRYSHIGLGVTIFSRINIGENVTIGGGAVVLEDIPDNVTAVGLPAKIIKHKEHPGKADIS
jgi:sugar O-acyltransferase (sialic acid O-acetyltransferase NeuD family)